MALTKELGIEQVDKGPELDDLSAVIERAVEVIGDREKTYRWLGTPVRAIAYATPISLLATAEGRPQVLAVLSRLDTATCDRCLPAVFKPISGQWRNG